MLVALAFGPWSELNPASQSSRPSRLNARSFSSVPPATISSAPSPSRSPEARQRTGFPFGRRAVSTILRSTVLKMPPFSSPTAIPPAADAAAVIFAETGQSFATPRPKFPGPAGQGPGWMRADIRRQADRDSPMPRFPDS